MIEIKEIDEFRNKVDSDRGPSYFTVIQVGDDDDDGDEQTPAAASSASATGAPIVPDDLMTTTDDQLLRATYQLFASEREYNWRLAILMEGLEKLSSSLSSKHQKSQLDDLLAAFFETTSSLCLCSISLIARLEKILANWRANRGTSPNGRFGNLFDESIWIRFDAYHQSLGFIRPFIRLRRRHDRKVANLCSTFERTRLNGGRFETLLLLPEERIVAYNEHLDALVRCTSVDSDHHHHHPDDYSTLKTHKDHVEHRMLDARQDEIRTGRNEQRLDQIESQFPVDRLDLLRDNWLDSALRRALAINSSSTLTNMKQLVGRRKSIGASVQSPSTWFRNSVDNGDNNSSSSNSSSNSIANNHQRLIAEGGGHHQQQRAFQQYSSSRMQGSWANGSSSSANPDAYNQQQRTNPQDYFQTLKQQHQQQNSRKTETFVRVYMKEGRVVLTTGVQTQERYLFLFSDLLLVAKENYRGVNSYRLKEKIRLCEVWLNDKCLDEVAENVRNPQLSFVIGWPTKSYVAEFKTVEERNSWYEILVSTIASVKQKERPNTTIVNVKFKDGKTTKNCDIPVNNFETAREMLNAALTSLNGSTTGVDEFQLWVQSGRETAAYPLHGHECPFAILLSHIRDLLPDSDGDVDVSLLNDLTVGGHGIKCNFIVKKKRGIKKASKPSKHGAGQFVSHLKRKMRKQDSVDSACPPSPTGKLFGVPLDVLTESQPMPKPILALMEHLATEGAFMEGIFRKPPKNSTLRELKEKLDAGCEIDLDGVSPSVSASLLKEFFRQLPESVLVNEKLNSWISLCDETNPAEKLRKAKALASQLPPSNCRLLRHFLCLMHIIAARASYNQMNSFNLGICVAPSLSGASRYGNLSGAAAKRMTELVQYLIDNTVELFGEDTLTMIKAPTDVPPGFSEMPSGGDEYDPYGHIKQETSSLDSLTATGSSPSCSRPQSSLHQAVNISRDSGLCESQQHGDDLINGDSTRMQRCMSQSEDTEDDSPPSTTPALTGHQSVDNLASVRGQKRTTRIVSDPDASVGIEKSLQQQSRKGSSAEENGLHRQQVNVDSTDSVYESAESNTSLTDFRQLTAAAFRSSKRLPAAVLTRSASGDHLYLSERIQIDDDPLSTTFVNQEIRQSRRRRSPAGQEADATNQSPLTVSMTAGDSTYGSSPVSPESDGIVSGGGRISVDSCSRSCDPSPSPQPFMTRNSAYRKPARHRKPTAPQPPSPTNVCVDDDEEEEEEEDDLDEARQEKSYDRMAPSTDASNDDEADSGVHVMEVHTARPIVISCNCESSSSLSSDDEKVIRSARKSSVTPARPGPEHATSSLGVAASSTHLQPSTPSASLISEIYPLKSPCQNAWPSGATRFIVDSTPTPPSPPSKPDSNVVRRHSTRPYPNTGVGNGENTTTVRHSYDEGTLTERVYRGLELMMEKVENAHVGQEKFLRSRLSDSVNDSSTVTETSSEESTPHVSRESSSAQDYKQVARVMFDRSNLDGGKTIESAYRYANQPRSYQTLPMNRSSISRNDGSVHPMSSITGRSHYIPSQTTTSAIGSRYGGQNSTSTAASTNDERKSYSQYGGDSTSSYGGGHSSLPRYRTNVMSASTSERPSSTSSYKNESVSSDIPVRVVPVVPGQVRDRVQRYDRERLRRKTLGGSEFLTLAQLARHQPPVLPTPAAAAAAPTAPPPPPPPPSSIKAPQAAERTSRYDQQRSGVTAATMRSRFARTPHSQIARSSSLDRRTIDLREEERQKQLANAEEEDRRRQDISWSVRQYVKMFDSVVKNDSPAQPPPASIANMRRSSEEKYSGIQLPSSTLINRSNTPSSYLLTRQASSELENRRPMSASRILQAPVPATVGQQSARPYSTSSTIGSAQLISNIGKPIMAPPPSSIPRQANGQAIGAAQIWQSKLDSGRRSVARPSDRTASNNSESYV